MALTDVKVKKAGKGSTMAGLLGLLNSLNKLGGSNINDQAQMTGTPYKPRHCPLQRYRDCLGLREWRRRWRHQPAGLEYQHGRSDAARRSFITQR